MIIASPSTARIAFVCLLLIQLQVLKAQSPQYPITPLDQSYVPASPNAMGFQQYGNVPVTLYEGAAAISLPVYTVTCGSLHMPITLSYNYNGLYPLQDAGWVGLGWNLNAGGVISRIVEGQVDESQDSGYNYDQYSYSSEVHTLGLNNFLMQAYDKNLAYPNQAFDMEPDIYDAEFSGNSGKFFWYQGKAYQLSYNKQLGINWPSPTSGFTITTEDGTAYTFGGQETTSSYNYIGSDTVRQTYPSAWFLTMVVSADQKDTISLSYASYTWSQALASYQTIYALNIAPGSSLGYDPSTYQVQPSIQTQVLQSITCRNNRVSFIPGSTLRTDVTGSYPSLQEIDVIDSLTGVTVKKVDFSYEYFGQTTTSPATYERLALKQFKTVNLQLASDTLSYTFKYMNELGQFPAKTTYSIDYWGYYNGAGNTNILPPVGSRFYSPQVPSGTTFSGSVSREPNSAYSTYGALDTIVYPTGGFTSFSYQQNYYNNGSAAVSGPGICLSSSTDVSNNPNNPAPLTRSYSYLMDNGVTSSGVLPVIPNYNGPWYTTDNIDSTDQTFTYYTYKATENGSGIGGFNPNFYYQKVTETISSGNETHRSDHYFTAFPDLFLDVRQTEQIDYINTLNSSTFTPLKKTLSNFVYSQDAAFQAVTTYIDTEYIQPKGSPRYLDEYVPLTYGWGTYWVHPSSQQTTQYDANGDSIVSTLIMTFNPSTRNLLSLQSGTSDGQTLVQYFKYPEDYTAGLTGNMVNARVLAPVLETQTWMKQSSADSVLIKGNITQYDQSIFKPIADYALETTAPIAALNNQTTSGGLYTSLLSDSRYVLKGQIQYDPYGNPNVSTKASDMNISYLWDYRHSHPIANVKNAGQADIAYTSFEADGEGNWSFTGSVTADTPCVTGSYCYNIGQTGGTITKSGLTQATTYVISYWIRDASRPLSIPGSISTTIGKTINNWTYVESKFSNQTGLTLTGTGLLDELRLYPAKAQMTTYTYQPSVGLSSQCDADNRVIYYQYDGFNRLKVLLDQDHNVIKTFQYHFQGETVE